MAIFMRTCLATRNKGIMDSFLHTSSLSCQCIWRNRVLLVNRHTCSRLKRDIATACYMRIIVYHLHTRLEVIKRKYGFIRPAAKVLFAGEPRGLIEEAQEITKEQGVIFDKAEQRAKRCLPVYFILGMYQDLGNKFNYSQDCRQAMVTRLTKHPSPYRKEFNHHL